MIYVVLGMHKSGTTLVARMLHRSGIDMGAGVDLRRSYDSGEKFERESTKAINHAILGSEGMFSLDIAAPASPIEIAAERRAEMRCIIDECGSASRDWGFKDPRTCLTYPIWAEELPEHRLIMVFRRPEAMWPRYRPCERRLVPTRAYRLVERWCECYQRLLDYLDRDETRALVVDYERLMIEPGDGSVTKASLLAMDSLDPDTTRGDFPVAWAAFVCARHENLPANVTFQDNLLNTLLYGVN